MNSKKKILTIFYIFILLSSYTLSNVCKKVVIKKKYFDLKGIKEEGDDLSDLNTINDVEYEAFTFIYLDKYENDLKRDIISFFIKSLKAEESKIHLYSLLVFADKIFSSIGLMSLGTKSKDYVDFLNQVKKEVENETGLSTQFKRNITGEITKAQSDLDGYLNSYMNHFIADTTASGVSIGLGYLATHFISKAVSLSIPAFGLILGAISLVSGFGIGKLWNESLDEEIKINEKKEKKKLVLLQNLFDQIKDLNWVEKNIVFTGMSIIPDCDKSEVKFVKEEGIKYEYPDQIEFNMARRTCILKKDKCKNYKECMLNITNYIKSISEYREKTQKNMPIFDKDSCTLKNNISDYIKDL